MFTDRPPLKKGEVAFRNKQRERVDKDQTEHEKYVNLDSRLKGVLERAAALAKKRYQGVLDLYVPETGRNFMLWTYNYDSEEHVLPVVNATEAGDEHLRNDPNLAASTNIQRMCIVQPDGALFRLKMSDNHNREGAELSIVSIEDNQGKEYEFFPGMAASSDKETIKLEPAGDGLKSSGIINGKGWNLKGRGVGFEEPEVFEARVLGLEKSFSIEH